MTSSAYLRSASAVAIAALVATPARATIGVPQTLPFHAPHGAVAAKQRQWMSPQVERATKSTGLVFVSDMGTISPSDTGAVEIFAADNLKTPIGMITTGVLYPTSVAVDGKGVLYVANVANVTNGTVTAYAPPRYDSILRTYNVPPFNIAVARDGTLYDVVDNGGTQPNSVVEFPPGSTKPSLTIPDFSSNLIWSVAVDGAKNVYLGDNADNVFCGIASPVNADEVFEYAPGKTTGTNLQLTGLLGMGMMAVANDGTLLVAQCVYPGTPSVVNVFAPGTTTPTILSSRYFLGTEALAFDKDGDRLFVGNIRNNNVEELTYPGGKVVADIVGTFPQSLGAGIAVSPPLR